MTYKKSVCLLSLSAIPDDPRVRRQGDALHKAGFEVIGIGLPGAKSSAPIWGIVYKGIDEKAAGASEQTLSSELHHSRLFLLAKSIVRGYYRNRHKFLDLLKRRSNHYIYKLVLSPLFIMGAIRSIHFKLNKTAAIKVYWSDKKIQELYACASDKSAAIWIANDWITLPLAARLASERGGVYVYDTHEFALSEYEERLDWRWLKRPLVKTIEGTFIHGAAAISAVSYNIAEALHEIYDLPKRPVAIRNTPSYETMEFRPTGETIKVLYHGILAATRGLEAAIDSVIIWRPEFSFTIRGDGDPAYIASLNERIRSLKLEKRVEVVPPVPMVDLVREASVFDIGLFALPGHSKHNRFALPNKLFEYTMAGLALCVTSLPEMELHVKRHRLGVTFPNSVPHDIAASINSLDRDAINEFKRNSLAAAYELCWEVESKKMLKLYSSSVGEL